MQLPFQTVNAAFHASAARWPDRPFLHIPEEASRSYADGPVDLSYAESNRAVAALYTGYAAAGVKRGHRVAVMLGNRAEFFLHYLALNGIGASIVPLNAENSASELAHILRDSGCAMVIALSEHRDLVQAAASLIDVPLALAWSDCGGVQWAPAAGAGTASADEAALLYTSGSTGAPKGCMLSNRYMLTMGQWYRAVGGLCTLREGEERLLTPLPLVHMNALAASTVTMILVGGCIVQLDRFHPRSWWATVRASGATIVHYLGVMPAMLLQAAASPEDRHHAVKFGFGAGVHPKHHLSFEERFGFPLVESWSMTEVGGAAAVIASVEPRHVGERCFGKPGPHMEYRIAGDDGQAVPAGEAGELWVRAAGPDPRAGFFSGYANRPELTDEAWQSGYFHTGDIVRQGRDGSLHFVDRKKSIIRRSGENIASLEVEGVISQLPGVAAVGVGPVDDEIRGEEVMACIRLAEGVQPGPETALALFTACAGKLAYYKLPGYIAFVAELPLTSSQKLQRGALKTLSLKLVARGEAIDLRDRKKRT